MVGFGNYQVWAQVDPSVAQISDVFSITSTHDLCLAAYSRWILIFMPKLYLCTKYVANLRQAAVSIKIITHRHSLDFGLHVVESYLDRLSSWNQGLIAHFLEKVPNWVPFFFLLPNWVPFFFLSNKIPLIFGHYVGKHVGHHVGHLVHLHVGHHVHLHVGRHVSHHVGHRNVVSTLCEVSVWRTDLWTDRQTDRGRC